MCIKIIFIGYFSGSPDEGLAQISRLLKTEFSKNHNVLAFNTFDVLKPLSILSVIKSKPQIIQYITGPTLRSFVILKILKILLLGKTKTLSFALRPYFSAKQLNLLKYFKPDLIFTQADKWRKIFENQGIKTEFLPCPVDIHKFKKLNTNKKILRQKYNLPINKKCLLHVGHIRPNRNIEFLSRVQKELKTENWQVVVVGSTHFKSDPNISNILTDSGCIVINQYIENMSEIYNACDCYIFQVPGLGKYNYPNSYNEVGVIDMPLSILEAMACGLPVISTEIDSLSFIINKSSQNKLFFYNSLESLKNILKNIIEYNKPALKTETEIIDQINSESVLGKIEDTYYKLIN